MGAISMTFRRETYEPATYRVGDVLTLTDGSRCVIVKAETLVFDDNLPESDRRPRWWLVSLELETFNTPIGAASFHQGAWNGSSMVRHALVLQ